MYDVLDGDFYEFDNGFLNLHFFQYTGVLDRFYYFTSYSFLVNKSQDLKT